MNVKGIFPPIITTFDEKGNFDPDRYRVLLKYWSKHVDGVFVCGSYGSGPLLTTAERQQVLEVAASTLSDKPLIVHIGAITTNESIQLARHAEAHNAVAVAAVPPYYYSYSDTAIKEHFKAILDSVAIPVYAYDNPKTTGNAISPKLLDELAHIGLSGLKDSSFDIGKLYMAMRTVKKPDFDFVIGSESMMLPAFAMGVRGCIAGLANAFPEVMHRFYQAAISGNGEEARAWQERVLILWDILHIGPSVPTAYELLRIRGFDPGQPRRPLLPLDADTRRTLEKAVEDNRSLWDIT